MISILIFTFYIVNQICSVILYQIRLLFLIFEIKYCLMKVLEQPGEGAELPRLTPGRYATNVTQMSINNRRCSTLRLGPDHITGKSFHREMNCNKNGSFISGDFNKKKHPLHAHTHTHTPPPPPPPSHT